MCHGVFVVFACLFFAQWEFDKSEEKDAQVLVGYLNGVGMKDDGMCYDTINDGVYGMASSC